MANPNLGSKDRLEKKAVRRALSRLVSRGVEATWDPPIQPLLDLPLVRVKIDELGDDHVAEALRQVLESAIDELGQSQYRALLMIVLGLAPGTGHLSAKERRVLAGEQFRGGERPVSAGTIRQHHEPKALDRLAELLTRDPYPAGPLDLLRSTEGGQTEWHPVVHERLAEEDLTYWRLAFAGPDLGEGVELVQKVIERLRVSSWTAWEVYGGFDLMLRLWLPRSVRQAEFQRTLEQALGPKLNFADVFVVYECLFDSAWEVERSNMVVPLEADLQASSIAELSRVEQGKAPEEVRRYEELGFLRRVPQPDGMSFFMTILLQDPTRVQFGWDRLLISQITQGVQGVLPNGLLRSGLYRGSGFAHFLFHGIVHHQDLPQMRDVIQAVAEAVLPHGARTSTFLASSSTGVRSVEQLPSAAAVVTDRDALELLEDGEDAAVEIRAFALNTPGGGTAGAGEAIRNLARTVTAMLNSGGGTIVLGAWDRETMKRNPELVELERAENIPRVGSYLVTGVGEKMDGPELDRFERSIWEGFTSTIQPSPLPYLNVEFEKIDTRVICLIRVGRVDRAAAGRWFYFGQKRGASRFFVRRGPATVELSGPVADEYKRASWGLTAELERPMAGHAVWGPRELSRG